MLNLAKILQSSAILTEMKASTPGEVFDELLNVIPIESINRKKIKKELIAREKQSSTAIGHGVAIPHVRTKQVQGTFHIIFGRSADGIQFADPEGGLTHIFFMIIGPEDATGMFLKLLGQISLLMKEGSLRRQIMAAKSNYGILQAISETEESLKLDLTSSEDAKKELMVIVLFREEYLEDVYAILMGYNVTKATILDGIGIGKAVSQGIPLFNTFRDIMQEDQPANKTILAIVDKEVTDPIIQKITELCGGFDSEESGMLFTLPIGRAEGLRKNTEKERAIC